MSQVFMLCFVRLIEIVFDSTGVLLITVFLITLEGCPIDHDKSKTLAEVQQKYASGCPMHAENHSDYIDPTNMVSSVFYCGLL